MRPLLRALYAQQPDLDATVFLVPDDYATGREAPMLRALFANVRVVEPKDYVRFALGRSKEPAAPRADAVVYLGGDLMHAARLHKRLGGRLFTYKFAAKRYAGALTRAYALDAANAARLGRAGIAPEKVEIVGNLAIDGALAEAAGAFTTLPYNEALAPQGGVLVMPGTRKREVANLIPFFLQVALWLRRFLPHVPCAFGLSPFTTNDEVAQALAVGGDARFWGARGRLEGEGPSLAIVSEEGERFAVVREALRYARAAACVVTIPGTKCIELAALGIPALVCSPLNAPELIVINGPLTYLDRVPAVGPLIKRTVVQRLANTFEFLSQPNMDAGAELQPELRGALMPARVAHVLAEYVADEARRNADAAKLRALYAQHAGAAERMAQSLTRAVS